MVAVTFAIRIKAKEAVAPPLLAAMSSANGGVLGDPRDLVMPPVLKPNIRVGLNPLFCVHFAFLGPFCSALLAAALSGTLVPNFSLWLTLSNATVLCAKQRFGVVCLSPITLAMETFYKMCWFP